MPKISVILFDLDGTLVDTSYVIARAIRSYLSRYDIEVDLGEILNQISDSPRQILLGYVNVNELNMTPYWSIFKSNLSKFIKEYTNTSKVIMNLHDTGYKLGISTSMPKGYAAKILDMIGIEDFFDIVVGYHDTIRKKPYPDPIIEAMNEIGAIKQTTVYIGDTPNDIIAGKHAGVHTGGALWGYGDNDEILRLEPDFILREITDILPILRGYS